MKEFLEGIDKNNNDYLYSSTQINASGDEAIQTVLIEEINLLKEYIDDVSLVSILGNFVFYFIKCSSFNF